MHPVTDESVKRATAALDQEQTVRGLLETACRELVENLDAQACAISRVVGDLLIALAEFTHGKEPLELGHEYLISDYPLTLDVVQSGEPRAVSLVYRGSRFSALVPESAFRAGRNSVRAFLVTGGASAPQLRELRVSFSS